MQIRQKLWKYMQTEKKSQTPDKSATPLWQSALLENRTVQGLKSPPWLLLPGSNYESLQPNAWEFLVIYMKQATAFKHFFGGPLLPSQIHSTNLSRNLGREGNLWWDKNWPAPLASRVVFQTTL